MQVSWIRHRDVHILTVGRYTYTKDSRFSVYHQRHTGEWTLQLRSAQLKDSGLYECQIGTQPTRSFFVNLQVVGKQKQTERFLFFIISSVRHVLQTQPCHIIKGEGNLDLQRPSRIRETFLSKGLYEPTVGYVMHTTDAHYATTPHKRIS